MSLDIFDIKGLKTSDDLQSWICDDVQFQEFPPSYLLAFSDEGVVWGKVQGNSLNVAKHLEKSDALGMGLFQQIHIFNLDFECRFWKGEDSWQVAILKDDQEKMVEMVYLWGTHVEGDTDENGFTLVADGRQGLRHIYPKTLSNQDFPNENHTLKLKIHQFVAYDDETGQARINGYRLVDLLVE